MSQASEAIDSVIKNGLAHHLKGQGFRKHGRTFCRDAGGAVQIVNAQGSQSNEGEEGRFTLNLGVYYPAVASRLGKRITSAYPKEYECTHRRRIGQLMPRPDDFWWHFSGDSDLQKLGGEVLRVFVAYGQPWLDRALDPEFIMHSLEKTGMSTVAAAIAIEIGQPHTARLLVEAALREKPQAEAAIRKFAQDNGIVLRGG